MRPLRHVLVHRALHRRAARGAGFTERRTEHLRGNAGKRRVEDEFGRCLHAEMLRPTRYLGQILEFEKNQMLTIARTGESIGLQWSELDVDGALWTVPGERMKGGETHTVHLVRRTGRARA
jgi:integrase